MTSNFEECPTGILVDYIGNTTLSFSPYCDNEKELEDNLNVKDSVLAKSSDGTEEQSFGFRNPFVNNGAHNNPSNQYLGDELNRKKDEMSILKMDWRSPSPTTMNMITIEASRIVDQLHTTLETSLWEEEFPMAATSEDESFEEFANEPTFQTVTLTKCASDIEESLCFIKEKNSSEKSNLTLDNPKLIDNSVAEENYGVPKMYFTVTASINNSNVESFKENCETTKQDYENAVKNCVETEETCVTKDYTTNEFNPVISEKKHTVCEGHVIFQKGNGGLIEGGCAATENGFAATEGGCTATEEGCLATEEDYLATEEDYLATEEDYLAAEEGCLATEEGCAMTEEKCVAIKESCIVIELNSNITRKISKHAEEIDFVAEDNFRVFAEFSDRDTKPIAKISSKESCYTITDKKQKHSLTEGTVQANNSKSIEVTPLSMKSKLTKIFKTPSFKTPIKYKKLEEKENIMQEYKEKNALSERKNFKIGQVSSIKSILSTLNSKGAVVSTSKSSIKTPLNKNIVGKIPFGRENKSTVSVAQAQEKLEKFDTPLKRMNLLKFQPALSKKPPLCKANSVVETPSTAKAIRRSNSFQTCQVEDSNQIKGERSFMAESRPKSFNSRMSLSQTQRIGNELQTPSKIGSFLPKSNTFASPFSTKAKSCAKEPQVACLSFGSALKQNKASIQNCPQVVGFKRPASTTSKTRFASKLEPLPNMLNDSLPRRLFPDYNTPLKRRM